MRFFSSLIVLLAISGCRFWTDTDYGLVVNMESDRSTVAAGESAQLRITLTNHSFHPVDVSTPSCPHYFEVADAQSRKAGPPRMACALIGLAPTRLEPGQTLTVSDSWAADSGNASTGRTFRLAPGTYVLRAVLPGMHGAVRSAPMTFTVEP